MSFISLPVELQLMMIAFLNTRDVVVLGQTCKELHGIAEHERAKRQDIDRLLSRYVDDTQGFRRLMRKTRGIIVGDVARAFFTGERPKKLELLFFQADVDSCLRSWLVFIARKWSLDRCSLRISSFIDYRVRCPSRRWLRLQDSWLFPLMKLKSVQISFPSGKSCILCFRDDFLVFPKKRIETVEACFYDYVWASHQCNYISWNTAVCTYPRFLSGDPRQTFTWLETKQMDVYQRDEHHRWTNNGNIVRILSDMERPSVDGEQRRKWKVVLRQLNGERDSHDIDPDDAFDVTTKERYDFIYDCLFELRQLELLDPFVENWRQWPREKLWDHKNHENHITLSSILSTVFFLTKVCPKFPKMCRTLIPQISQ